jgi:very-short-patch-repair endonuclease
MIVFTSFDPGMIDLTRTAADGVRDLKTFVEFADRGPRALAESARGSLGGADSPFEEAVAAALRRRGWTIVPQVGVSKFRIDLGVVHPDRPGDYLVGIECDGAAYHSAATARDRDKVRAAILEGLGWKLLRIWSTDWWIDRQRAADRLHAEIEACLAADRDAAQEREATTTRPDQFIPPIAETDLIATQIEKDMSPPAPAAEIVVELVPADGAAPEPVYARQAEPISTANRASVGDGLYRLTDFAPLASIIDPHRFYEPAYDTVLGALVAHVLAAEAPIAETLLVQRIARAHGFQRAGRTIQDRVTAVVKRQHTVEVEADGRNFVWEDAVSQTNWDRARAPATAEDIRQIEDIALTELRAARRWGDAVDVARKLGVRRLSAVAKARIERA